MFEWRTSRSTGLSVRYHCIVCLVIDSKTLTAVSMDSVLLMFVLRNQVAAVGLYECMNDVV